MGLLNQRSESEKVKVAQSYSTLCDPVDYRAHGILQARILEWVAFPFSRGSSQPKIRVFVTLVCVFSRSVVFDSEPVDCSLPGSSVVGVSRQEYWSGLPFPSPGDLPDPGIKPRSPALQSDSTDWATRETLRVILVDVAKFFSTGVT